MGFVSDEKIQQKVIFTHFCGQNRVDYWKEAEKSAEIEELRRQHLISPHSLCTRKSQSKLTFSNKSHRNFPEVNNLISLQKDPKLTPQAVEGLQENVSFCYFASYHNLNCFMFTLAPPLVTWFHLHTHQCCSLSRHCSNTNNKRNHSKPTTTPLLLHQLPPPSAPLQRNLKISIPEELAQEQSNTWHAGARWHRRWWEADDDDRVLAAEDADPRRKEQEAGAALHRSRSHGTPRHTTLQELWLNTCPRKDRMGSEETPGNNSQNLTQAVFKL